MKGPPEVWNWSYRAYEAPSGNRPVQEWFTALSLEVRDEIRDLIDYLRHLPIQNWQYPRFEQLGDGISEIRVKVQKVRYRVYGYFGPPTLHRCYTFLHGCDKKVSNDRHGKKIAKDRMAEIDRGDAKTHEFEFESLVD